jgi:hypothetical protein
VLAGKAFGDTGPYEEIVGKVYYSLDPDNSNGGGVMLAQKVQGYRHEPNVAPDSATETYVTLIAASIAAKVTP